MRTWKIGELAAATGITVRTLHHYDEIGLLQPSARTAGGYRQYHEADLARLQKLLSLRALGLPLDDIRRCLDDADPPLALVLRRHGQRLAAHIEEQQKLARRLDQLADRLESGGTVSADEFLTLLEMTTMIEKYYTPEQLEELARRRAELGEETIRGVEAEWPQLIERARAEMAKGTDPAAAPMQAIAHRWQELIAMFTGGDAGIARSLNRLYQEEPQMGARAGIDAELFAYVGKAIEHSRS